VGVYQPSAQTPICWASSALFVWYLPFDLSAMGGLTSSYATIGIAFQVIGTHRPPHHEKVGHHQGGPFLII